MEPGLVKPELSWIFRVNEASYLHLPFFFSFFFSRTSAGLFLSDLTIWVHV